MNLFGAVISVIPTSTGWMTVFTILALAGLGYLAYYIRRQEKEARRLAQRDPYTEGLNLMLAGKLNEAADAFTKAAAANTANADAYVKLGTIYRMLNRPKRAAQIHLEMTVRTDLTRQMQALVYRELALDLEKLGNLVRAHKCLDHSRRLDPQCTDDLEIKLRLLETEGKWREAGETLKKLQSLTGRKDNAQLALYKIQEGEALCREGKEHDGRILFKEALKINPDAAESMLFIAASYAREHRQDDAMEWISQFIETRPQQAELAVPMLEKLLYEAGRFGEVEPIIRKAVGNAPDNRRLAAILIDLLAKKGEIDEALDLCDRLLETSDSDPGIRVRRLQLLERKGDRRALERGLDDLLTLLAPHRRGYYCRACGYRTDTLHSRCPQCGKWRTFFGDRRREPSPAKG